MGKVDGRIEIPIQDQTTRLAAKGAFSKRQFRFDLSTSGTLLGGWIKAGGQSHFASVPCAFVKDLTLEFIQTNI